MIRPFLAWLLLAAAPAASQLSELEPLVCGTRADSVLTAFAPHGEAMDLVLQTARRAGIQSPRGLVYVAPGFGVRSLEGNVPDSVLAPIAIQLVDLANARQTPRNPRPALVVRLDPLPLPACGDGPRREVRPRLRNMGGMARQLSDLAQRMNRSVFQSETLQLRIVVSRDGRALAAEVIDSQSPLTWDEGVLQLVERMRFQAPTVDGVPQDVLVQIPIRLAPPMWDREPPAPRMP